MGEIRGLANFKHWSAAFLSFRQRATTALHHQHCTRGIARITHNVATGRAGAAHRLDIQPGPAPRREEEDEEPETAE